VTAMSAGLALFPKHARLLQESGIDGDVARARGYVSVDTKTRLEQLGFSPAQRSAPGLLVPLWDTTGELVGYQYRPDDPREIEGKPVKYESLPGSTPTLDVNPVARTWIRNSTRALWITEGSRKVDALASVGLAAIGLQGVSSWTSEGVALAAFRDVRLRGRKVIIGFDSDVMTKPAVRGQLDALAGYLAGKGAEVHRCDLPQSLTELTESTEPHQGLRSVSSVKTVSKVGVDDFLGSGRSVHDLERLVRPYEGSAPLPLGDVRRLPPFPVHALPPTVGEMVGAVAEATQTDPGMAGTLVLGVLSACTGGRAEVEVRPGWREPTNMFVVVASPPGTRKTGVFRSVMTPLLAAEKELVARSGPARAEAEITRSIAEKAAETARKKASSAATPEARQQETANAIDMAAAVEAIEVPPIPRLLADDATPEAVAGLLAEHGGRLTIASPEGGIFDVMAGRYSNGVPSLDVFLKGHAGDELRVDRRGRPAEYVPNPALTLALAVQPVVLSAIGRNGAMSGRGLLARFLYSIPENLVGRRRINPPPVPTLVQTRYVEAVRDLAVQMAAWTDPAVVTLSPEATGVFLAAETALEPRLAGDLQPIVEWASKLMGVTARLAAVMHLAEYGEEGTRVPIPGATAQNAITLAAYFTEHALGAFGLMGIDAATAAAQTVLDHLREKELQVFTVRALHVSLGGSRFSADEIRDALTTLEDHGWVTRLATPPREGPGRRPSPTYTTHPHVWEKS
jgi:hypothetical protein